VTVLYTVLYTKNTLLLTTSLNNNIQNGNLPIWCCSVSLEVLEDGKPKPPKDAMNDGLPKLYVNHNGFMKVLGCTLDVDVDNMIPILYDPSGNVLDPNV